MEERFSPKGKKDALSDFERGMVFGARWAWSEYFRNRLIYWDFQAQSSLGFIENGLKRRIYLTSDSSVDKNTLLMPEVSGKWTDWFESIECQL